MAAPRRPPSTRSLLTYLAIEQRWGAAQTRASASPRSIRGLPCSATKRVLERGLEQFQAEVDLGFADGDRRRDSHDAGGVAGTHDVGTEAKREGRHGHGVRQRLGGVAAAATIGCELQPEQEAA